MEERKVKTKECKLCGAPTCGRVCRACYCKGKYTVHKRHKYYTKLMGKTKC